MVILETFSKHKSEIWLRVSSQWTTFTDSTNGHELRPASHGWLRLWAEGEGMYLEQD